MPTFSVTVSAQNAVRIQKAFQSQVNAAPPSGGPPVTVDQDWIEAWLKQQLQNIVHRQESIDAIQELPPPPPIT